MLTDADYLRWSQQENVRKTRKIRDRVGNLGKVEDDVITHTHMSVRQKDENRVGPVPEDTTRP